MAEGIRKRHSKGCSARGGGRCNCKAGWEAWVFSRRDRKKIRRTFARKAEAKSWRAAALGEVARGQLRVAKPITLNNAWRLWHEGARAGSVTNRSGDPYKPSALRSYERAMRLRLLPEFGSMHLADISRPDLQDLADSLLAEGASPSLIKVTFLPLRAIFRRAVARGELALNPCDGLELAAVRGRRERIASVDEAEALIAAVRQSDRAIWATAMYAGLRRGELQALRVDDLDLDNGVLRVERGWDEREGEIAVKSRAGRRKVPIAAILRTFLVEHLGRLQRQGGQLVFGRTAHHAFNGKALQDRADAAWSAIGLDRITLHECRHTFASLMIAAGVNPKALQTYMGHASVSITLDRYGHLMPGSEAEAADLLDTYLKAGRERNADAARRAGSRLARRGGAPTGASAQDSRD